MNVSARIRKKWIERSFRILKFSRLFEGVLPMRDETKGERKGFIDQYGIAEIAKVMKSSQKTLMVSLLAILALFGGALIYFTMEYLSSVTSGDAPPTPEIIHQIGFIFLAVTMMAGMPAVGMGAYVMYVGARIRATGQWPPAGMGFQSKSPIILGARTNLVSFSTMGLGGILVLAGLFLPLLGWRLMSMLGE